jgi:hypothetical protein
MPVLTTTPEMHRRHLPLNAGSDGPIARARAEGKRGPRDPLYGHATSGGGAAGHRKRAVLGKRCWNALPSYRSSSQVHTGEGEDAEGGLLAENDEAKGNDIA